MLCLPVHAVTAGLQRVKEFFSANAVRVPQQVATLVPVRGAVVPLW
jgi:hypothetical protein